MQEESFSMVVLWVSVVAGGGIQPGKDGRFEKEAVKSRFLAIAQTTDLCQK